MRNKCRKNIRKARRNQLDWDSAKEEHTRRLYANVKEIPGTVSATVLLDSGQII